MEYFHFLRPHWLLALIPLALLVLYLLRPSRGSANWRGAIDAPLLEHLSDGARGKASRLPWLALAAAWLIGCLALAGPTWEKLPQPVHQRQDALVIVLDLSLSMLAEDTKPSRLVRARHKVLDILQQRREGLTALVAYSGDAHIVAPLTDDQATVANLVPALSPLIMPVNGSDPVAALDLARSLFSNTGLANGEILLITDGLTEADVETIDDSLKQSGLSLSILGIGTVDGAPIPADRGFLKDQQGNIIVPQLRRAPLERLAEANAGRYTDVSLDDSDIRFLLPPFRPGLAEQSIITEREFDQWLDRGAQLSWLLLPLALLAFRRGWLLVLPLVLTLNPAPAQALEWQDLWQTPDQQGAAALQNGDAATAARQFEDPQWKGSALYRAGDYEAAAEQFASDDSANAHFNRGNALARAGDLQQAIEAYQQALAQQPDMEDAAANKALVEQLLQQQQQQQDAGDDSEQQGDNQQGDNQQDNSGQSDGQQSEQQGQQDNASGSGAQGDNPSSDNPPSSSDKAQANASSDGNQPAQPQQSAQSADSQPPAQEDTGENARAEAAEPAADQDDAPPSQQADASRAADPQRSQQQRATEQWLRQIPDDPAGLLRRKFHHESQRRRDEGDYRREQPQW